MTKQTAVVHQMPADKTIRAALELSMRAPSVHNSQPWRWRVNDRSIDLYADPARHLTSTDPDRRDMMLSCGATLHHFRIAMAALGWSARVRRLPNPGYPDHLAEVSFAPHIPTPTEIALTAAIPLRRTDRRRYSSWRVPPGHVSQLISSCAAEGVAAQQVTGRSRQLLLTAVSTAASRHANDPHYLAELELWSGRQYTADGVPAANATTPDPTPGAVGVRRFAQPQLAQITGASEDDAAVLLVIATSSDDRMSHLRAGEAASAALLTATSLGLASCPLSEPLEVADTRTLVRDQALAGGGFPQLILRTGWGAMNADPVPAAPRRHVSDVVEYLAERS